MLRCLKIRVGTLHLVLCLITKYFIVVKKVLQFLTLIATVPFFPLDLLDIVVPILSTLCCDVISGVNSLCTPLSGTA